MDHDQKRLHPIKGLRRTTKAEIRQLARHFDRRAAGNERVAELVGKRRPSQPGDRWTDIPSVSEAIAIARALYEAGRLTYEECFFYCVRPVEALQSHNSIHGDLRLDLDVISARIDKIKQKHGLSREHDWRTGDGPDDYLKEVKKYERALDTNFGKLLKELGLSEHARLWRNNRDEYDRLREAGRLAIFEPWDLENALVKLIALFEHEAKTCAGAKAYYAACAMLGSATEALLLLKCQQDPTGLAEAKARLPKSSGFDRRGPHHWNLSQLVEIAKLVGWISDVATEKVVVHIANLVGLLHDTRNLVHPGRHATRKPHVRIGEEQYKDAKAAYRTVRLQIESTLKYDKRSLLKK